MILHAGLIARRIDGRWRGVLVLGASGSGKSDLIIRAVDAGFRLVSDDRTVVWMAGGRLFGRAPDTLAGLIELRGMGVLGEPALPMAEAVFAVRCEPPGPPVERVPEEAWESIGEARIPLIAMHALEASAPAKLGRTLMRLGHGGTGA